MSYSPFCIEGFDAMTAITDLAYRGNWVTIGAGLVYNSTGGRNGAGCITHNVTGSSTIRGHRICAQNRPDGVEATSTTMKIGFAFRINYSSAPSTSQVFRLINLSDSSDTTMACMYVAYFSGNWRIGYGLSTAAFTTSYTIGPNLPASGTWFHVECEVDEFRSSAPAGINLSLSVNGITPTSSASGTSNIAGSGQSVRYVKIASCSGSSTNLAAGESIDFDDFHFGSIGAMDDPNTNFLGDMRVDHVEPISDGTDLDFTESAGTDYYALLDETTPGDGDTTYIYGTAADNRASVKMAALPHNPTRIVSIHPYHIARREGAGSRSSRSYIKVAGTRYEGLATWDLNHGTSYAGVWLNAYDADLQTNPDTAVEYTKTDLQNIEIGVRISV